MSYDTPQGIAFYRIDSNDSTKFAANCKKCMYVYSSLSFPFLLVGYMLMGFMHAVVRRRDVGPLIQPAKIASLMSVQRPCRDRRHTVGGVDIWREGEGGLFLRTHAWSGPSRPYFFVLSFVFRIIVIVKER